MMIGSGITILESLEHLSADESLVFSEVVKKMCERLSTGCTFSLALSKHPNIFPRVCSDLVAAGESSGTLHKSLDQLADYLERSSQLEQRFKAAMVYPMIITILMSVMVLVMVWFVFPREKELLESLGAEMPFLTRLLFDGLGMILHPFVVTGAVIAAVSAFSVYSSKSSSAPKELFRKLVDKNILHVPIVGQLLFKLAAARVLSVFATLLESGATVDQSMYCAARLMGNTELEKRLILAQSALRGGSLFSDALEHYEVFPGLAIQLFRVAEESGGLPKISGQLARIYEAEVETAIDMASALVEPFAMIFMGGFVGLLLLATLLPTASIVTNL